ncbi:MAG: FHA domain-containing protein [Cyanobacteria bacterium P01_A01_bin.123]
MIVCPNCSHQNPDGAAQCEACYTPLPTMASCPSCGASVQSDASFCGQCGFDLRAVSPTPTPSTPPLSEASSETAKTAPAGTGMAASAAETPELEIPELFPPEPLVPPDPIELSVSSPPSVEADPESAAESEADLAEAIAPPVNVPPPSPAAAIPPPPAAATPIVPPAVPDSATQIQVNSAKLFHIQTNTTIELPSDLPIIHIGKPNDRIPPVVDVSGFPDSEIVSRIHAGIRVEGDVYYIEDVGSSNGTYINNMPLSFGNRHRLRPGDRIALGKGDKVSFLFQT